MVRRGAVARALSAVAADWRGLTDELRLARGCAPTPGLHTFRSGRNAGPRLHLRIHDDGSGALFVNVGDPVHLPPASAQTAHLLLTGVSEAAVARHQQELDPQAAEDETRAEVARVARMVARMRQAEGYCPHCDPDAPHAALFAHRAQAPYKIDLALTYRCDNRCAHCYNEPGRRQMPELSTGEWRRLLRLTARIGVPHVIFTGGEPTLREDLSALIRFAERQGQIAGVNTNGRRLAEPGYARRLRRAGLDHVQITLLSEQAQVHDALVGAPAHHETVAGIRRCLEAGLHTITNTTLTRSNLDGMPDTISFIHGLGIRTFAVNSMICSGSGRHNSCGLSEADVEPVLEGICAAARQLDMRLLWYTPTEYCALSPVGLGLGPKCCNAAEYSVCIEPNGDVLPCQSYYEPAGNALRAPWESIWNSDLFARIRNRRERPAEAGLPLRCWSCEQLRICGGGCPLRRSEIEEQQACRVAVQ